MSTAMLLTGVGSGGGAAFDPLSLSPALWLKADAGTFQTDGGSAATADADPVGQWQDQSGNDRHFLQGTAAARPTVRTGILNSLPGVLFDGTDDTMAVASAFLAGTAGVVMAVVTHQTGGRVILASSDLASNVRFAMCRIISEKLEFMQQANDTQDRLIGDTVLSDATPYLLEWRSTGTATAIAVNGEDDTLTVSGGANNGDWWGDAPDRDITNLGVWTRLAGSDDRYKGHIHELIVVDQAVSADDLTALRSYLMSRWGL